MYAVRRPRGHVFIRLRKRAILRQAAGFAELFDTVGALPREIGILAAKVPLSGGLLENRTT